MKKLIVFIIKYFKTIFGIKQKLRQEMDVPIKKTILNINPSKVLKKTNVRIYRETGRYEGKLPEIAMFYLSRAK